MKPYSLLPFLALVSVFVLQPLMAGDHKKKPSPDRYIQGFERKLADIEKRMQDTDKSLKQANADFREQTQRKAREFQALTDGYAQHEARALKAIKEYREQQDSISAALKKYRVELAAKQATAAKKRQEEAKKAAAAKKAAEDAKRKTDSSKKPEPKPRVDPKNREAIRKKAEESRRAHLKRFDTNRDGKVTKEESKAVLTAEAKRRDAARKKSSETRRKSSEDARKKPAPKKSATKKPTPKKSDLDRLRANYVKAQKSDQSAKGLYEKAKRTYDEARGNKRTYKVDLERLEKNYERAKKNSYTMGRALVNAKRAYEYGRRK